jgi:hypothetical protein
MDEFEQQRRRDFISQVRANNRAALRVDQFQLAKDVAKLPREDHVAQWKADSEERSASALKGELGSASRSVSSLPTLRNRSAEP